MHNLFEEIERREPLLSVEEFFRQFDEEWGRVSRRFFKFEGLQTYDEGDESGFVEFQRGDYQEFASKVRSSRMEEKSFYDTAIKRGTSFRRLRSVRHPLSNYLKFEFYTYFISAEMGEDIRFLQESELEKATGFSIPDLVLFDDAALFQYRYDGTELVGGYCIRNRDDIQRAGALLENLFSQARPFTEMMAADPLILSLIKSAST